MMVFVVKRHIVCPNETDLVKLMVSSYSVHVIGRFS